MLAGLALATPATAAAAQPRDLAAVALHPWRIEVRSYAPYWPLRDPALRERTFSTMARAGIRRGRIDLKWSTVQPGTLNTGTLLPSDWSEFDAITASAKKYGIQLEPIVAFTPGWANANRGPWAYPTDPNHFRDFMRDAIARYPQIRAWEIWNEPNWSHFSKPRPDPAKLVAMLRAAHAGRAAAGSNAKLVVGGLSPAGEISIEDFAERIARLGAFRYADVLGVHPYSHLRPDTPGSSFLELPKLRSRVSRAAGRPVDLWITEYGDPNEAEQSVRLQRGFALAVGWPWLKRLTWYGFRDDCSLKHPDCRYGLLRENFSPKPVWGVFGSVLAGRLPRLGTRLRLYRRSRKVKPPRRRKKVRHQRLSGSLFMPGRTAQGTIVIELRRRYKGRLRKRQLKAKLTNGRFRVELGRLKRGRWRFAARFDGDGRYAPSGSRRLKLRIRAPRKR